MKKFVTMVVLLFVLSISAFADGQYPIGNRICPQGQTCIVADGQFPIGNKTCGQGQTCLVNDGEYPIGGKFNDPIIKSIFDFLKSILG